MDENRTNGRSIAGIQVKISHPNFQDKLVDIVDISESGMYALHVDGCETPDIGATFDVEIMGIMGSNGKTAIVPSKLVRTDDQGFGIHFLTPIPD